jgi:mannose/fructose/N-acetylgalactosamine-specific phosphotransferase system component IID
MSSEVSSEATLAPLDQVSCALCRAAITPSVAVLVNDQPLCATCENRVAQELREQQQIAPRLLPAVLLGAAGALVGAVVWAAIMVATEFEVGYVAVLVGFLTGIGVRTGAGKARDGVLPVLSAGLAIAGLFVAKFMFVSYMVVSSYGERGVDVGYFDSIVLDTFGQILPKLVSPLDALFVFLAVGAAMRPVKAPVVKFGA